MGFDEIHLHNVGRNQAEFIEVFGKRGHPEPAPGMTGRATGRHVRGARPGARRGRPADRPARPVRAAARRGRHRQGVPRRASRSDRCRGPPGPPSSTSSTPGAALGVDGHFDRDALVRDGSSAAWPGARGSSARRRPRSRRSSALTVALHLLLASMYRPSGPRRAILIDAPTFPSDRYAVESHLRLHGMDPASDLIVVQPEPGDLHPRTGGDRSGHPREPGSARRWRCWPGRTTRPARSTTSPA